MSPKLSSTWIWQKVAEHFLSGSTKAWLIPREKELRAKELASLSRPSPIAHDQVKQNRSSNGNQVQLKVQTIKHIHSDKVAPRSSWEVKSASQGHSQVQRHQSGSDTVQQLPGRFLMVRPIWGQTQNSSMGQGMGHWGTWPSTGTAAEILQCWSGGDQAGKFHLKAASKWGTNRPSLKLFLAFFTTAFIKEQADLELTQLNSWSQLTNFLEWRRVC